MKIILKVLRKNELYANKKKCSFAKSKVDYLGHIISGKGVKVDLEKIRAIPEEIYGYLKNKAESWDVLISWKGLPRHEVHESCMRIYDNVFWISTLWTR